MPRENARETQRRAMERRGGDPEGDVGSDLGTTLEDRDTAVYLVHSIGQGDGWAARELQNARNLASAAVRQIVHRGGLEADTDALSEHLSSRHAVKNALRASGVDVIELSAEVIIGSGSASFEMLRYLVGVLPVMVTPKWIATRCQPIALSDVVDLSMLAITAAEIPHWILEAGGPTSPPAQR